MARSRLFLAAVAWAALVLLSACDGEDTPATATATLPPTATSPTATGTTPPARGSVIDASNAASLSEVAATPTEGVNRLAWSPDSGALLVDGGAGVVRYGAPALDVLAEYLPAGTLVLGVSPDGRTAAILDGESVALVDVTTQQEVMTLAARGPSSAAVFYEQGARVGLAAQDEILVSLWDTTTGTQVGALGGFDTAAPVYSLVIAEDGERAAWVSRGTVQFHDVAGGALGERLEFEDFVTQAAFDGGGTALATITGTTAGDGALAGLLQLWDPETGAERWRVTGPELFSGIAFSPDGSLLAVATEAGVRFYVAADGREAGSITTPEQPFRVVAFSPDGSLLATVDDSQTLRLWALPE